MPTLKISIAYLLDKHSLEIRDKFYLSLLQLAAAQTVNLVENKLKHVVVFQTSRSGREKRDIENGVSPVV